MSARGLFRRPLLIFGILLIGPAAGFAWLGWRSVEREDRARIADALKEAREAADQVAAGDAQQLEELRQREERRPYFHYQAQYMPEDVVASNGPAFVDTPLTAEAGLPGAPRGWFQYLLVRGRVIGPEIFCRAGVSDGGCLKHLDETYGEALRQRLKEAPSSPELQSAVPVAVPLEAVAANEEVGALLEQMDVSQRENRQTAYLENFNERVQQRGATTARRPTISIKYSPFHYVARPPGDFGYPLIAWRLVAIPGREAQERRDAPVDRWLLEGYVPTVPLPLGNLRQRRRSGPGPVVTNGLEDDTRVIWDSLPIGTEDFPHASLLDHLSVERTGVPGEELFVTARPSLEVIADTQSQEHSRYLLISGGLLSVVGIGFFVLTRSVRTEVAAARKKEDFVAAVTHELKTPLTGIRMYGDMLREGWASDADATAEYAGKIVSEAQRLDALVDQVLALAAYDHGVASYKPQPADMGEAVRAAVAMLEPKAAEAGVPIRIEVEEGLPLVPFDAALMRGIVLNLVDNAVKYSGRSATKDVLVRVQRDASHGSMRGSLRVALVVADRGAGIPAKDRKRVFEPFYRAGHEETRTVTGVGIGLALVERYAEAHGAKIALASEEGKGTTVSVSFPV